MIQRKIKQYLDENGIKYTYVANAIEMPMNTFSAMLNGNRNLKVDEYFKICNVLKVDTNYFNYREEQNE